ncbi:TPA: trypsin-like peptidase domain-containing protein [Streptococcus suis]|uniref:trypsin-like serine peptidase n=1 Tax=Streptococcus suis TaxID=1307 RepID=UPI0003F8334F|nr:serine protease [Streptococcus suis]MCO8202987.1 serine protease [Streptococcus suis]HEM3502770.1 trypsin-like peptidase domain-containing protein [Streptococcus suis]HEM3504063.1 trypsin-like peptidase domain-containing protein [Streptococcus suis]
MDRHFLYLKKYVGILSFKGERGGRQKATGCLFNYNGEWLVATAAHCIFDIDIGEFNRDFHFFLPDRRIELELLDIAFHSNWIELFAPEYDIAFFRIAHSSDVYTQSLDEAFVQPKFEVSYNNVFDLVGYPMSFLLFNKFHIDSNKIGKYDETYNSTLIGISSKAKGGMSGSPLLILENSKFKIVGTVSLSFNSEKDTLWSAKWNEEIKMILDFITLKNIHPPIYMVRKSMKGN